MSVTLQVIALCNFMIGWVFGFWAGCRHVEANWYEKMARRMVDLDNERRAREQTGNEEGD